MHWPNLLHLNPERNSEVVEEWVRFLRPYQDQPGTCLPANSESFRAQLVYHVCTRLAVTGQDVQLDFSQADVLPGASKRQGLKFKIQDPRPLRFKSDSIEIASAASTGKDGSFLYTLELKRVPGRTQAQINVSWTS